MLAPLILVLTLSAKAAPTSVTPSKDYELCNLFLQAPASASRTDAYLKALLESPLETFQKLRTRAREALRLGHDDIVFAEMEPTLIKMLTALQDRLSVTGAAALHPEERIRFEKVLETGRAIQKAGIYYKPFTRYTMEFIGAIDADYRRKNPQYQSRYHEELAKVDLEKVLARSPFTFVFPSFDPVSQIDFIQTRAAPVHLVGLSLTGLFGDGFHLTPAEFAWHDWGHIGFVSLRDFDLLSDPNADPDQVVAEWEQNRKRLYVRLQRLVQKDPELAEAALLTLFEVVRERGYPYDLHRLKPQFEISKWSEIIDRKLQNGFWGSFKIPKGSQARLTEARNWLLKTTESLIERESTAQINALRASRQPVRVRVTPRAKDAEGTLVAIEFSPSGPPQAVFMTAEGEVRTSLMDVSLAQVSTDGAPAIPDTAVQEMESILLSRTYLDYKVRVDTSGEIEIVSGGKTEKIDPAHPPLARPAYSKIEPVEIYKIRQLLAEHQRGRKLRFTLQGPNTFFDGKLIKVAKGNGVLEATFETGQDKPVTVPMSGLKISRGGRLVFGYPGEELTRFSSEAGMKIGQLRVENFINGSEVHLTREVTGRPVTIYLPRAVRAEDFLPLLSIIRTAKTLGAASIEVATPSELSDVSVILTGESFGISIGNSELHLPLERILSVAGADWVREGSVVRRLKTAPIGDLNDQVDAIGKPAYLFSVSHSALTEKLSALTGIPIIKNMADLPPHSPVYLVASIAKPADRNLVESMAFSAAFTEAGHPVSWITPYIPFARLDKVDHAGETTVAGRLAADIVEASGARSILFVRAHAAQSQGFYRIHSEHLLGRKSLGTALKEYGFDQLASPDEGAAKEGGRFAKELGLSTNMFSKSRDPITGQTKINFIRDRTISGLRIICLDDEVDTGGTVAEAAALAKSLGAAYFAVAAVHLTGNALKALDDPNVDVVIVTDSIPITFTHPKLRVVTVANEIADVLREWERNRSGLTP